MHGIIHIIKIETKNIIEKTKKITLKTVVMTMCALLMHVTATAQGNGATLNTYTFKDGATIRSMADNGEWATAYGPSATNGSLYHYAKRINVKTKEILVNIIRDMLVKTSLGSIRNKECS